MDINQEDEKEDYSMLDESRKAQIILELQNEINKQKSLYLNKEQKNYISNFSSEEISKNSINKNNIISNNNRETDNEEEYLNLSIESSTNLKKITNEDCENNYENNNEINMENNIEKSNENNIENSIENNITNSIFNEINTFVNNNEYNNKNEIKDTLQENLIFSFNKNYNQDINECEEMPLPQPQMMDFLNKREFINNNNSDININNTNNIKNDINNINGFNTSNSKNLKNTNYLNLIKDKKNNLFPKDNKNENYKQKNNTNIKKKNININNLKINNDNSYDISSKKYKIIKSAHNKNTNSNSNKKTNLSNINNNNKKIIKKSKSSTKIKTKIFKSHNNSIPHHITSNEKSKEKYEKIKIEVNNKFKKEHPFRPKINSKYNENNLNETEEERYYRLSRPKTYEIKGRHLIKNEDQKLENKKDEKINNNKVNPKQVTNRLYKLHQQIKNKKAQVQKQFEEKEMNKYNFKPNINNYSKKLMNKSYNNVSFNERNDNYIKQKKENINKLREEIDKQIKDKSIPKINEKSKIILNRQNNINNNFNTEYNPNENNVYNRLYENKYCSNNINIELDKNDFIDIKPKNNTYEINDFLERQKIFENLKKEHIYKYKLINKDNNGRNDELTFKPKINSTSDLIAKSDPERKGEDINDKYKRLYDEAEKIKEKKEQLTNFYNAQYDFTPKINELSKIIGNLNNKKNLFNDTMNSTVISNINKMKKEIDNECTFKPNIITNQKYNYIQSNYKFDDNISQKIQEELINKNNKMNILKSEQLYNCIQECKFIPDTNKYDLNIYNNNDTFYQKGLKKYMEQMEKAKKAKKEKEEREKKVFITGENWKKNNINITPKPFNLSKNNNKKIEKIKQDIKNEEMKECSFKPITNETKNKDIVKKLLNEK